MPGPQPQNLYSPVPEVATPTGGGNDYFSVRSTPADMGAQVGQAVEKLGATSQEIGQKSMDLATHFAQMATESKVNDDYANKYVPAATQLRAQYDSLRGQDKIAGYDTYINGLKDLNKQFVGDTRSPYESQLVGGLIDRHIESEIEGAKRELVQSQKVFSDQSTADMIKANNGLAANNYNAPDLVANVTAQNNSHIVKAAVDNGADLNTEEGRSIVFQTQKTVQGDMAVGMINRALSSGDANAANSIRASYASMIPGWQQLYIDGVLHTENTRQTSSNNAKALQQGQPFPEPVGFVPSAAQANVANAATTAGLDANHALTVCQIESACGRNLGNNPERASLGQDKESVGKPLSEQARLLCEHLKIADARADEVLGRKSQGWEGYTVYQQGTGGGAALLTADRNTKAVDVLATIYKDKNGNPDRQTALAAIQGNGGNATMTTGDFLNQIKKTYDQHNKFAECDFSSNPSNPGAAIMAPHEQGTGQTVQPAVSPVEQLRNWNDKYPAMLAQAQAIPNLEVRQGVLERLKTDYDVMQTAAHAYKANMILSATGMAIKPDFTSLDQMPAELQTVIGDESPATMKFIEQRSEYNRKHTENLVGQDDAQLGKGFYPVMDRVFTSSSNPNAISDITQLQDMVNKGEISNKGYDMLVDELQKKNTPGGEAELAGKRQLLSFGKSQISGDNQGMFVHDPKGEALFRQWMALTLHDYKEGLSQGRTPAQLLSPDSSYYLGKSITMFQRTSAQFTKDMTLGMVDNTTKSAFQPNIHERTPEDVKADVRAGRLDVAKAKAELLKMGVIAPDPAAPDHSPSGVPYPE